MIVLRAQKVASLYLYSNSMKYVLLKDQLVEISIDSIIQRINIILQRHYEFRINVIKSFSSQTHFFFRSVFNCERDELRFIMKLIVMKDELKLKRYDKSHITSTLKSKVISLSYMCFIDDFELYKNMYKNLFDIYLTMTEQSLTKKQSISNIFSMTLEFHDFDINDVVRAFHSKFAQLKTNCKLQILKDEKIV